MGEVERFRPYASNDSEEEREKGPMAERKLFVLHMDRKGSGDQRRIVGAGK